MQQPEQPIQHRAEYLLRGGDPVWIAPTCRDLHLGELQVPVADLVPGEVVEAFRGLAELEITQQIGGLDDHLVQPIQDPPIAALVSAAESNGSVGTTAPFLRANLVALNSFEQNLPEPATHSVAMA